MSLAVVGASAAHSRLMGEVERSIRIVKGVMDVLEAEFSAAQNMAHSGLPKGFLTQLKEATGCLNSLTDAKVRLDKSAKVLSDAMSQEQEEEAVRSYIEAMSPSKRAVFLKGL